MCYSGDVYQEILKWQIQLHSKSSNEVQQFLNNNLDQIAKVKLLKYNHLEEIEYVRDILFQVRQSLEALSLLIVSEDEIRQRHKHSHPSGAGGGGPSVADLAGEVTQTQESSRGAS
jgi:transcriptional regulator of heat shock response